MTRVTNLITSQLVLKGLNDASDRVAKTQQRLSTGKEILRASDDPLATRRALALRGDVEGLKQYQTNVSDGTAWQNVTDVALARTGDYVSRVRELVLQAASDSTSPLARKAIADEVDQLVEAVKQEANTNYAGRFVFSGTETLTPPYAIGGSDAYAGNPQQFARQIGQGVSVPMNVVGSTLYGGGQAAGDDKLLHVLRDVSAHLRSATPADTQLLRSSDLTRLDSNVDNLLGIRAEVGAKANRLEIASGRLAEIEENATRLLSETEDADMARTMVDFSMQQAVYQAALRSGAKIVQASLLDFLR